MVEDNISICLVWSYFTEISSFVLRLMSFVQFSYYGMLVRFDLIVHYILNFYRSELRVSSGRMRHLSMT
jgi:hypothetical protein